MQSQLVLAIRKILNETKQDKTCRTFCSKRGYSVYLPFLGSTNQPAYCFLGASPAGFDVAESPSHAEDYIEWGTNYFQDEKNDRASVHGYLPYTSNTTNDYQAFGSSSLLIHLVPIVTPKSSDISPSLIRNCWPRTKTLLEAIQPKLIFLHGSSAWKFLIGLEDGDECQLTDLPEYLAHPVADLYDKVEAEKLAFQSRWLGLPDDYRPVIVPLAHLAGSTASKDNKKKAEAAVSRAKRLQSNADVPVVAGGRIRIVRKVP